MSAISVIVVAVGGALGAVLRYLLSLIPFRMEFPIATLITNLLGAFAIGFIFGIVNASGMDKNLTLFMKTGVCGGFTTFSTFSLETFQLFEHGKTMLEVALAGHITKGSA